MRRNPFAKARDNSKYGKRHVPGQMNQTESLYASQLQLRKLAGEVLSWEFEGITFKLADDLRYTPDFVVTLADLTMECIDCKGAGPVDPKSRVKIRLAADKFWQFRFVIEKRQAKRAGGGWTREEF